MPPALRVTELTKRYDDVAVLNGVSFEVERGGFTVLRGRSGSGKTTLFKLLAALDRPTSGHVLIEDVDLSSLSDDALADLRLRRLGIVFQAFNLLPDLTASENVRLPLDLAGVRRPEAQARAAELLELVGMTHRAAKRPNVLSGGEQQRVAIARALANEPAILLADEPTGNLDRVNASKIFDLLEELNSKIGTTVLVITHDDLAMGRFRDALTLVDGQLSRDPSGSSRAPGLRT